MGPNSLDDPPVELVEKPADVGLMIVLAPSSDHRVKFPDHPFGRQRYLTPGDCTNSIFKAMDRFLRGIGIQSALSDSALNLGGLKPQRPTAAFDLVSQKCKPMPDVHDACLAD